MAGTKKASKFRRFPVDGEYYIDFGGDSHVVFNLVGKFLHQLFVFVRTDDRRGIIARDMTANLALGGEISRTLKLFRDDGQDKQ